MADSDRKEFGLSILLLFYFVGQSTLYLFDALYMLTKGIPLYLPFYPQQHLPRSLMNKNSHASHPSYLPYSDTNPAKMAPKTSSASSPPSSSSVPNSRRPFRNFVSSIIKGIDHYSRKGEELPHDRHRNPPPKETLREDVISI